MNAFVIRQATDADWPRLWAILKPVLRAGDTYSFPREITADAARQVWLDQPTATFLAEHPAAEGADCLGTYYLKANQPGQGAHVANCGYVVATTARGLGVATALCRHSQGEAVARGFRAMQFNLVVTTNTVAVALWQREGFSTVGRLPGAFRHPHQGFVDALVMFKTLG